MLTASERLVLQARTSERRSELQGFFAKEPDFVAGRRPCHAPSLSGSRCLHRSVTMRRTSILQNCSPNDEQLVCRTHSVNIKRAYTRRDRSPPSTITDQPHLLAKLSIYLGTPAQRMRRPEISAPLRSTRLAPLKEQLMTNRRQ